MLHDALKDILANALPDLEWTVNYYYDNDNTGTVYVNGGNGVARYESPLQHPSYQIFIRSTDWDKAELYADRTLHLLNKRANEIHEVYLYKNNQPYIKRTVELLYLENQGGVLSLGVVEDDVREYSINFDATLRIINEEEL